MDDQDIHRWRVEIVRDTLQARKDLDALNTLDHDEFVILCRKLAQDPNEVVKRTAFWKLGQLGDRDDLAAESSALAAIDDPRLRDDALFALRRVGTSRAFPALLIYAKEGSATALESALDQVRSQSDADQLLPLARQYLLVPGTKGLRLREASLRILLRLSTPKAEQAILLSAARLFADDFVVEALAEASVAIIPDPMTIRSSYPKNTLEYRALSYAIDQLEQRNGGESGDMS